MSRLSVSLAFCLAWACAAASGQQIVDGSGLNQQLRDFNPNEAATLNCEVFPMEPHIDFGFRFQAGYVVRVPMKQYFGPNHMWGILVRVTPEATGKPVFLVSKFKLPDVPKTDVSWEVGGSYLLGVGRYRVAVLLLDDQQRGCSKEWTTDIQLKRGDRGVELSIPPATVWDYASSRRNVSSQPGKFRLSVLVHAAPLSFRATRLRAYDRAVLLSSLATLLERIPALSVKMTVFSLEKQRELFSATEFRRQDIGKVAEAMDSIELGMIDYSVLQNRKGHVDLLAEMINAELTSSELPDAVIILGPHSKFTERVPDRVLKTEGRIPPFFYFQYRPRYRRGQELPDSIQATLRPLKGKSLAIYTPQEFAKAIRQVEERLGPAN